MIVTVLDSRLVIGTPGIPLAPFARRVSPGLNGWAAEAGHKMKEVLVKRFSRSMMFVLVLLVAVSAVPAFAGVVPSKTADNQSLAQRDADLALVRDVAANQQVASILAQRGFTQEQVNQKLSQLNQQDLHQLAQNLDQLQAAGLTRSEWLWIAIGAIAALVLIIALS